MLKTHVEKSLETHNLNLSYEFVRNKSHNRVILSGPVSAGFVCSVMSEDGRCVVQPETVQKVKLIRSVLDEGKLTFIFDSNLGTLMRTGEDQRIKEILPEIQQRVLSRLLELHRDIEEEVNILLDARYSVEIDWVGDCKKFRMENEATPQVSDASWLENFGPEYAQVIHLNIPQKRGFLSEAV